jgi:hypothetical protein
MARGYHRAAMIAALATLVAIASPTPAELLLQGEQRGEFLATWAPAFPRLVFEPARGEFASRDLRLAARTLAALVRQADGSLAVLAPAHRLRGVQEVTLEWPDGLRVRARVDPPNDADHTPAARLVPDDPALLQTRVALEWADQSGLAAAEAAEEGTRQVWAVEWAGRSSEAWRPTLVHAQLLGSVEPPLERFRYATVEAADGLALLDHQGRLRCFVFRGVPLLRQRSLCAPTPAAALEGRSP